MNKYYVFIYWPNNTQTHVFHSDQYFLFSDEEAFPWLNNFSFDTPKQMFFKLKPLNKQMSKSH